MVIIVLIYKNNTYTYVRTYVFVYDCSNKEIHMYYKFTYVYVCYSKHTHTYLWRLKNIYLLKLFLLMYELRFDRETYIVKYTVEGYHNTVEPKQDNIILQ